MCIKQSIISSSLSGRNSLNIVESDSLLLVIVGPRSINKSTGLRVFLIDYNSGIFLFMSVSYLSLFIKGLISLDLSLVFDSSKNFISGYMVFSSSFVLQTYNNILTT